MIDVSIQYYIYFSFVTLIQPFFIGHWAFSNAGTCFPIIEIKMQKHKLIKKYSCHFLQILSVQSSGYRILFKRTKTLERLSKQTYNLQQIL